MENSCSLILEKIPTLENENYTALDKILNDQNPFYEITKTSKWEYKFLFRTNLHNVISSGKFIRKNCN